MTNNFDNMIAAIGKKIHAAKVDIATSSHDTRCQILDYISKNLQARKHDILQENHKDVSHAYEQKMADSFIDRLLLDEERIDNIIRGVEEIKKQPDPVGNILEKWKQENGLDFQKISVPIGVLGFIYESRPNVTIDGAALSIKSGNAIVLRCGSESFHTSKLLSDIVRYALEQAHVNPDCVCFIDSQNREAVHALLKAHDVLDVLIPRGGKSLVRAVQENATMPVFSHLEGNCHLYIHHDAQEEMVNNIVINAKCRRMSICGACESVVVHEHYGKKIVSLLKKLHENHILIKGDEKICALFSTAEAASQSDYFQEYLGPCISIKFVCDEHHAIEHINHYSSHHTDGIITDDQHIAALFFKGVDSAICLHNASTQFADGYEFGFGGEIGIATGKLHARGPVAAKQLTSYKYCVTGHGTVRL